MQTTSIILTSKHRNGVSKEVHDDKEIVMGQCKTTDSIELESLNAEAMSYPWIINTIEV